MPSEYESWVDGVEGLALVKIQSILADPDVPSLANEELPDTTTLRGLCRSASNSFSLSWAPNNPGATIVGEKAAWLWWWSRWRKEHAG